MQAAQGCHRGGLCVFLCVACAATPPSLARPPLSPLAPPHSPAAVQETMQWVSMHACLAPCIALLPHPATAAVLEIRGARHLLSAVLAKACYFSARQLA